jgi:hypothetical protein
MIGMGIVGCSILSASKQILLNPDSAAPFQLVFVIINICINIAVLWSRLVLLSVTGAQPPPPYPFF